MLIAFRRQDVMRLDMRFILDPRYVCISKRSN